MGTRKESAMKVSSIADLKKVAEGEIVELPSFSEDVPFIARLRRPSLLALVKNGSIPNSLLVQANNLFSSGASGMLKKTADANTMKDLFDIIDVICEDAFVEPTYKEIREAGIRLTDEQMMAIFSYSQRGVKALEPFRGIGRGSQADSGAQDA